MYSSDLSGMISNLLQVEPKKRPSAEQILHMPVFIAKYNEHKDDFEGSMHNELLGTIKIPRNLSLLTEILPKAQYEEHEEQQRVKREIQSARKPPV